MVISTNLNLGYLGSWTDYYVLPAWQAVKLTFFACKCHMIIFHLNVKNVIQHYCIQEMGWGGGGEREGERHWILHIAIEKSCLSLCYGWQHDLKKNYWITI